MAGESHLHVMNTISCPLVIKMSQNSVLLDSHDIESSLNYIIYDLKPEIYEVEVKQSSQQQGCRNLEPTQFRFNGQDKEVCTGRMNTSFG